MTKELVEGIECVEVFKNVKVKNFRGFLKSKLMKRGWPTVDV